MTKKSQEQITNFLPTNCPSLTLNEVLSIKFIQRVSIWNFQRNYFIQFRS